MSADFSCPTDAVFVLFASLRFQAHKPMVPEGKPEMPGQVSGMTSSETERRPQGVLRNEEEAAE